MFTKEQLDVIERYTGGIVPAPADMHGLTLDGLEFIAGYLRGRTLRAELRATVEESKRGEAPGVTAEQFAAIYQDAAQKLTASLEALEKRAGAFGDGARFAMSQEAGR